VDGSTAEAEREQAAERVPQAEQDERDRQEVAEYRCQFPGVAVPNTDRRSIRAKRGWPRARACTVGEIARH
jgi:hypothetical protein